MTTCYHSNRSTLVPSNDGEVVEALLFVIQRSDDADLARFGPDFEFGRVLEPQIGAHGVSHLGIGPAVRITGRHLQKKESKFVLITGIHKRMTYLLALYYACFLSELVYNLPKNTHTHNVLFA